jgi:serine/threonine protein kinase
LPGVFPPPKGAERAERAERAKCAKCDASGENHDGCRLPRYSTGWGAVSRARSAPLMQPSNVSAHTYPQPGEVLEGKYRIEHMLGEGGMGAVAKATHIVRRAPVALKFMSGAVATIAGAVERFVNEGVAASQIDSDHVVKVFDVGRLASGAPYLVMEYLEGRDLGEILATDGPRLAIPRGVHFALQMLRALDTAHNAGIVHRDMKPSNCFVIDKDGEADFLKLVDFGISKFRASEDPSLNANLTRTNSSLGTPLYMSPEQARSPRDVDHRSDLYSVAAILYEMLCGRTPYTCETGEFTEILFKIFTTEPDPIVATNPDVPDDLAAVVHRALLRERDDRYGSALDMAEALAPFADERSAPLLAKLDALRARAVLMTAATVPTAPPDAMIDPTGAAPTGTLRGASQGGGQLAGVVPTDVGVTRDTRGPRLATRTFAFAGLVAAATVLVVAIGLTVARSTTDTPRAATTVSDVPTVALAAPAAVASGIKARPQATASEPRAAPVEPRATANEPRAAPVEPRATATERAVPLDSSAVALVALPSAAFAASVSTKASAATPAVHRASSSSSASSISSAASISAASAGSDAPALPKQLSDLKLH